MMTRFARFGYDHPGLKRVLLVVGATIPILVFLGSVARISKAEVDATYFRRDSMIAYKAEQHELRLKDSLIGAQFQQRTDERLDLLVRACRKKGDCP